MRAITLHEPYASFMACGVKTIETRHWSTPFRGRLAIHAAKGIPPYAREAMDDPVISGLMIQNGINRNMLPLGSIVAVVTVIDVVPTSAVKDEISDAERALGGYEGSRFAWITDELHRLTYPLPCKGRQGFWNVPDEMIL